MPRPRLSSQSQSQSQSDAKRTKMYKKKPKFGAGNQALVLRQSVLAPGVRTKAGFPPTLMFVHKYYEGIQMSGTTTLQNQRFSVNGLYDPNVTGAGHQPMFFDQLGAIYNHYRVLFSKIKWTIVQNQTGPPPVKIHAFIHDEVASFSGFASAEHRTGQSRILSPDTSSKASITQQWSISEYFPRQKYDDELKGTTAANPVEQMYYTLNTIATDQTTSHNVWVVAEVEYTCEWSEPKDTDIS